MHFKHRLHTADVVAAARAARRSVIFVISASTAAAADAVDTSAASVSFGLGRLRSVDGLRKVRRGRPADGCGFGLLSS